jgi:TPR repeat protein
MASLWGQLNEGGIGRNLTAAVMYYNQSAEMGNEVASTSLGYLYATGTHAYHRKTKKKRRERERKKGKIFLDIFWSDEREGTLTPLRQRSAAELTSVTFVLYIWRYLHCHCHSHCA